MSNTLKYIFLAIFFAFANIRASAQSFIFIQADKDIPFNVKINNKLVQQYSKSYIIIPQLSSGTQKIYIVSPNGEYPPQRYIIEIPDKGSRSFQLTRYQGAISLYDIQNLSYISGEIMTEKQMADDIPDRKNNSLFYDPPVVADSNTAYKVVKDTELTYFKPQIADRNTEAVKKGSLHNETGDNDTVLTYFKPNIPPRKPANTKTKTTDERRSVSDTELTYFKPNIPSKKREPVKKEEPTKKDTSNPSEYRSVYDNDNTAKPANNRGKQASTPTLPAPKSTTTQSKNCVEPLPAKLYDDIYIKSLQKTEKERLKFLLGNLKNCFSTNQLRVLTLTLSTDPERYAFLKQASNHVTDKQNFESLEDTLTKREWKDYFELLLQ